MEHPWHHWKNWPYWLRGGVVALGIALIFIIFQFILVPHLFYVECDTTYCMTAFAKAVTGVFTASMTPLWSSPLAKPMFDYQGVYIIISLAYYFVIGAFIGLMYEKLAKKSQ